MNARFNTIVELSSVDVLERIVGEERRLFPIRYPQVPDDYAEQVKNTWWIFSYRQLKDHNEVTLELGAIDPLAKFGRLNEKNQPHILPAFGPTKKELLEIKGSLEESIKPYAEFKSLGENIEYHWKKIHTLIREISPKFDSISSCSQVGFHKIDGLPHKSRIAKNIDDIPSLTKELMALDKLDQK